MRIRKTTTKMYALLVTIILVFTMVLPGENGVALAAKYSDVEITLDSYIKNELKIPRVEFAIDSGKIQMAVNVDSDDDTIIIGKIGILASAAGAAAPWTKSVEISVYSATAPLVFIKIPTGKITDYHNDRIDTQTYLASWEFAGIPKMKGAVDRFQVNCRT